MIPKTMAAFAVVLVVLLALCAALAAPRANAEGSAQTSCAAVYAELAAVPGFAIAAANVAAWGAQAGADGCPRRVLVERWAAITDQRRDVLDLTLGEVRRILRGDARDWSELGGSRLPISVVLPASQADRAQIASALRIPVTELVGERAPAHEIVERVAAEPGAFALIRPERLRLGVLALTVEGHDPYRDPARDSPLRLYRWLHTEIAAAPTFDPAGMLVTGELIPVRCTNHVLAALDNYHAMFDGVRDHILAADIAVAPLESSLTELGEPTPCVETLMLHGSPRVVPALVEAGIDVVLTIGNHMMDCYGGCSRWDALFETLDRLDAAGIAAAGAGATPAEAAAPAVLAVDTARGPVTFAFLGYDSIAPYYHVGDDNPGINPLNAENVRAGVLAARPLADHVIVAANWGIEYVSNPNGFQRAIAGVAVEAGATFLMGNHPHWVQAVEHFDDALVAYSFGNFVFDQGWSVETVQGMLMELGFTADRLIGYRIRPVIIRAHSGELPWRYRPDFVDPAGEGLQILTRIWRAQDRLPAR